MNTDKYKGLIGFYKRSIEEESRIQNAEERIDDRFLLTQLRAG